MRIGFAGTPEYASTALQALLDAGYAIELVLTQPDRPAGRGMKLQASPVKQLARQRGIAVWQPQSLRLDGKYPQDAETARQALQAARLDVLVVAAYGLLLPRWVLELPAHGCLNIHASLLPRWRGAAPIHRAIEAGDTATGVTIMQLDKGLDTGAMLLKESVALSAHETTGSLHDRLAALGGTLIVQALRQLEKGPLQAVPQPGDGIRYAHKISKAESWLDWREPAEALWRKIRAFDPFPAAQTSLHGQAIKVWQAAPLPASESSGPIEHTPGRILRVHADGIDVACGQQTALRLTELQRAGGRRMPVAQLLNGFAIAAGDVLQTPDDAAAPPAGA